MNSYLSIFFEIPSDTEKNILERYNEFRNLCRTELEIHEKLIFDEKRTFIAQIRGGYTKEKILKVNFE